MSGQDVTFRVYFNNDGDKRKVWSVDQGPGTEELHFAKVTIWSANCVTSIYIGERENAETPVAWLEVVGRLAKPSAEGHALII